MNPFKCPLCCKQGFETISALHHHLVFHVLRPICCPICTSSSDGILNFIDHLKTHLNMNAISADNNFQKGQFSCVSSHVHYVRKSYEVLCELNKKKHVFIDEYHSKATKIIEERGAKSYTVLSSIPPAEINRSQSKNFEVKKPKELTLPPIYKNEESLLCKDSISFSSNDKKMSNLTSTRENVEEPGKVRTDGSILLDPHLEPSSSDCLYIHKKFDRESARIDPLTSDLRYNDSFQVFHVERLNQSVLKKNHDTYTSRDKDLSPRTEKSPCTKTLIMDTDPCPADSEKIVMNPNNNLTRDAEKDYKCTEFKRVYASKSLLTHHPKTYECSKKNVNKHDPMHLTEKMHQCKSCPYRCLTASGLRNHKFRIHSIHRKEVFICQESENCGKFKTKYSLERHKMRRHKTEPKTCKYCDKNFKCMEDLNRHLVTHKHLESLTCANCNKVFASLSSLKRHRKVCSDVKSAASCS